jgi:hypothetical protein
MTIENYENLAGETMVKVLNEDGSVTCYTEQQYADYQAAQVEHLTEILPTE